MNNLFNFLLFSGNANPLLSNKVADCLAMKLSNATVGHFCDGEITVEILENVRGKDIFLLQPTCRPVNETLVELLIMVDALRRASAARITAVVPYFGYARQDRRVRSARVPITAKVVADMLTNVGVDRLLTVDLHADQVQGFFSIPVDNVYGSMVMLEDIERQNYVNPIVVSPDVGGVVRARALAKKIDDCELAIIDKRRPRMNESQVMNIIGDVSGKTCIVIDDIVDTASTLCKTADALKAAHAEKVIAYCTHPVLSGHAVNNITQSGLDELVVTDTIPLNHIALECPKIRCLTIAPLLAEAIRRVNNEESISAMFR